MQLKESGANVVGSYQNGDMLNDIIKNMVINPEDVVDNSIQTLSSEDDEDYIDYLVITTDSLSNAFKSLVDWKTKKGIKAQVVTLEYIKDTYINKTVPLQIKDCLFDLWRTKKIKYVLLGGDDTIVPVQGCYGFVKYGNNNTEEDLTIPTDLFYACLLGMNWDANNNGVYGEVEDKINMSPSLYVTRVPVRTVADTRHFVDRITTYESNPGIWTWEDKILMAGNKFAIDGDAAAKGQIMYEKCIKPYWNGKRVRFYDTETDFPAGASYDFTAKNLQEQLSLGYNFVDIITHGGIPTFRMEKGSDYSCTEADGLINPRFTTIITTTACHTNAFDSSYKYWKQDPCLSESFIRSRNSGVLAYLGCSRDGWDYEMYALGASPQYNGLFYKYLFSTDIEDKNFGKIVAAAKAAMIGKCQSDGPERWIQFGLNPIGDPEMPIFTESPKYFPKASITQTSTNITVDTGIEGCRICVMDSIGGSYYEVAENVKTATFYNLPKRVSVCVTKQNYVPKFYDLTINGTLYLQNQTICGNSTIEADKVLIGSKVTRQKTEGKVVFKNGSTIIKSNTITIDSDTIVEENGNLIITNEKF